MKLISYISTISIPLIILIIIFFGIKEKKNIYELFLEGVKNGAKTVINLFPTLLAIFLAIGMLRASGIFEFISNKIIKFKLISIELLPLAIIKPISGSGAIGIGTEIMKKYGVDSLTGRIAATMMGSTETTLYVIAVYTSKIKTKNTRHILCVALIADFVGIIMSIIICNIMFS